MQKFGATESILRTGGGMSDLPLQRLSVPNKLQLDLYTGVLVPVSFQVFTFTCLRLSSVLSSGTARRMQRCR